MKNNMIMSCRTMTNTSSVISSITSVMGNWLINQFPKGYIRNLHVADFFIPMTTMSDDNHPTYHKYGNQTLYIQPTWDPSNFSYDLPRWHKTNEFVLSNRRRNYSPVLEDWDNKTFIYSVPNRLKVNFQCRIKLKTYMQGVDVAHMLTNIFDIGGYRYLNNVRLQTELPPMLVKPICLKQGYDWSTDEGKDQVATYLSEYSYNGIHAKRNMSTGNRMYAYNYRCNVLINVQDYPDVTRNPEDLSVGDTYVDFSFSAEFWTPANFLFEADKLTEKETRPFNEIEAIDNNTLMFTLYLPMDYVRAMKDGKHLIRTEEFFPDVNVEYDVLNFKSILDYNLVEVIQTLRKQGYRIDNIMEVLVSANARLLMPEEYKVDWDKFELKTNDPMVNTTYRIIIYGDLSKINEIEQQLHPDDAGLLSKYTNYAKTIIRDTDI